jgi:hypothetical protein
MAICDAKPKADNQTELKFIPPTLKMKTLEGFGIRFDAKHLPKEDVICDLL